ncbi:hypothetical protein ACQKIK_16490 [Pseudomonas sp. NPDC047961]
MGTLLDLITSLGVAPTAKATATPICAVTLIDHQHQQPASEPMPAPELKATSEPMRTAWMISRAGQSIGYMVGQAMTYSEALDCALMRWSDAEILETR